jgi:dTDP-4-dehydrorhamnose 3,5-epimerase
MSSTTTSQTHRDHRGLFTSLPFVSAQVNISFTKHSGTLRGLHYREPFEEKLVLCTGGSIYDVIVDLETGEWLPLYMTSKVRNIPRFVPKGFAHGFQALEDNTEVFYVVSETYDPEACRGIRFDSFGIRWPIFPTGLSERDNELPLM